MIRLAAFLLCSLIVVIAAPAAPAPIPKPTRAWLDGWEKPVDLEGDCSFDRVEDKFTIALPGKNGKNRYFSTPFHGPQSAPYLSREVEGDFRLEVRIRGNFNTDPGYRGAGVMLWSGKDYWKFCRWAVNTSDRFWTECSHAGKVRRDDTYDGTVPDWTVYFRLTRRGDGLLIEAREKGKEWKTLNKGYKAPGMPEKLNLAVFAESYKTNGTLVAVFDEFRLTRLK